MLEGIGCFIRFEHKQDAATGPGVSQQGLLVNGQKFLDRARKYDHRRDLLRIAQRHPRTQRLERFHQDDVIFPAQGGSSQSETGAPHGVGHVTLGVTRYECDHLLGDLVDHQQSCHYLLLCEHVGSIAGVSTDHDLGPAAFDTFNGEGREPGHTESGRDVRVQIRVDKLERKVIHA